jgi:hypothetical protein
LVVIDAESKRSSAMTARIVRSACQVFNSGRFAADGDPLAAEDISKLPYERRLEVLDAAPNGSLYIGFGFFVRVSGCHLRPSQLTPLRWIGDDAGDKAVLALKTARGANLPHVDSLAALTSMRAHVGCAQDFVTEAETVPPWVDWDRIRRGQEFFLRNAGSLCVALLNLALIGGFGAPKINAVLQATGYLTRGKGTQRRLSETLQMVLDCIPDGALRPGGRGWHSVLNVRLLHAGVRTWLVGSQRTHKLPADFGVGSSRETHGSDHLPASSKVFRDRHSHVGDGDHTLPIPATTRTDDTSTGTASAGALPNTLPDAGSQANHNCSGEVCKGPSTCTCAGSGSAGSAHFDVAAYGVPINQEDLLVTQLAFSIVLLIGLERLGVLDAESASEMECYLHMWRYIGHLMGVEPRLNAAPMDTLGGAQAMLESIASHVVSPEPCARDITMHVLGSVSHKPPLPRSPLLHVALTRMLAGEWYADALGIPHLTDPDLLALDRAGRAELRKQAAASRVQTPGRGASSPFALPLNDEAVDAHHATAAPAGAGSSAPSSKPWQSFDAARTAFSDFGIAALLALAFSTLRGATYVWSLLASAVAAASVGRRAQADVPADGAEAAVAAARARADARAVVLRLKVVQWFTHLPWVGLPVARLMLGGAVRVVELQLGGRTHFPVRKRYL